MSQLTRLSILMLRVSSGVISHCNAEANLPWLLQAVAAHLALYKFTLKTSPPSRFNPNSKEPLPEKLDFSPLQETKDWDRGVVYAQAQNLARTVCFIFLSEFTLVLTAQGRSS
jgi:hypothetical protein